MIQAEAVGVWYKIYVATFYSMCACLNNFGEVLGCSIGLASFDVV
jgi:hypothetical protein